MTQASPRASISGFTFIRNGVMLGFPFVESIRSLLPLVDGPARWLARGARWLKRRGPRQAPPLASLYADYEGWLRRELRAWGQDLLLGPRARARGLFEPAAVQSLWDRHQSGRELHTLGKLAPLMTYELLLRRFVDPGAAGAGGAAWA